MATAPALKPDLIIQNPNNPNLGLKSSALIVNSLFWHYKPELAGKAEQEPEPQFQNQPKLEQPQPTPEPAPTSEMFNDQVGKMSEGLGDLFTNFASGNFFDHPSLSVGGQGPGQNSQINPATLFAPQQKLTPPSASRSKDLEKEEAKKKYEEELMRKKAQQYRRK